MEIVASAARVNFTGAVTLTVTGTPTGVSTTISQPQGSGALVTGLVSFTAAASTAPGSYPVTVLASGAGITAKSAVVTLTITAAGSYAINLSNSTTSVAPGGSGLVILSLIRNNFTAPITFVVDNLPSGVTAGFTPNPVTFSATTLTLDVAVSAPLGTHSLVLRGTSPGFPDRSVPLTLTVASLGSFTLSASPSPLSLVQGTSRVVTINIARTGGFSGIVLLEVETPPGLTAAPALLATGTASATFTLTAAASLPVGAHTLTIRGQAPGLVAQVLTVPVQVTAATGGSGNVTLDFSACVGLDVPSWVAYQDGNGPWTRATSPNRIYQFAITAATGGYAWAVPGPTTNTAQLQVRQMTRGELTVAPVVFCGSPDLGLKLVNGSVTGLSGGDAVNISLGGGIAFANPSIPTFALAGVRNGTHDLVAWRHDILADIVGAGNPDRGFIRRDQNIVSGASVGTLDMNGSESFTPAAATFTINGIVAGEEVAHTMRYQTGASCLGSMLYSSVRMATPNTFDARGFPASLQRATDFHQALFSTTTRQSGVLYPIAQRALIESFRTLSARTLNLGAPLPLPTITTLPGPYKRLQASFSFATEYNSAVTLIYTAQSKSVSITASPAWIGNTSATLSLPDFTGVAGWNDVWAPASGATGTWTVLVAGSTLAGQTLCAEGARVITAQRQGAF